jgi:hypothetical protein
MAEAWHSGVTTAVPSLSRSRKLKPSTATARLREKFSTDRASRDFVLERGGSQLACYDSTRVISTLLRDLRRSPFYARSHPDQIDVTCGVWTAMRSRIHAPAIRRQTLGRRRSIRSREP